MKIGESCSSAYQSPSLAQEDSISANFRRQINEAKKQLQEIAADKNLTTQQKNEKKQQITDTINDLNQQLRQYEQNKKQEQMKKAAQAMKEQREAALRAGKEEGPVKEAPSLSVEMMQAIVAAESTGEVVTVKEGVRMNLSHDAMRLSNAIKREENEGGVSGLRKDLNELYGQIGEITGEIVDTLKEATDALTKSLTEKEADEKESDENSKDSQSQETSTAASDTPSDGEAAI